jgi:type I restriction enzyme S subunit
MCLHKGIFAHISRQTTSIAHLGAERFSRLPFPVPPLDEQREISMTLDASTESVKAQTDSLNCLTEVRKDLRGALLSGSLGTFVVDDF